MMVMPAGAKRISSRVTFFYKRVFPVLWVVFVAFIAMAGITAKSLDPLVRFQPLFMAALMAFIGIVIFRTMLQGLMDEVWDNGKDLLVINGGHVEHVPLSMIMNISYSGFSNPKRAVLQLRQPGRWGEKLSFIPTRGSVSMFNLMDNPVVDDLVRRVDETRQKT